MQPHWHTDPIADAADPGLALHGAPVGVSVIGAVKDVFADPEWKHNVLFALIFMIIPIVGPMALSGWMCEVMQRKARRHPQPIPYIDFGDFGEYIKRGVTVFLVQLVVSIPVLVLFYGFAALVAVAVVGVMSATNEPLIGVAVGAVFGLIALLVLLSLGVVINAVHTRAELTENFSEALRLSEVLAYTKATFWRVLVKNFAFMFVAMGIIIVGMLACYIGLYPAAAVIQIAGMHLRFQVYDDYLVRGGSAIEPKPATLLPSEQRAQQYAGYGY
jgi:hypothetical protein